MVMQMIRASDFRFRRTGTNTSEFGTWDLGKSS